MLEMLMHWCSVKYDEHRNMAAYEEMVVLLDWKNPVQYERLVHTKISAPLEGGNSYISLATADVTTPNMKLLKSPTPKGHDGKHKECHVDTAAQKVTPRTEFSQQQATPKSDDRQPTARSVSLTPKLTPSTSKGDQKGILKASSTPSRGHSSSADHPTITGEYYKHDTTAAGDNLPFTPSPAVPAIESQKLQSNYRTSSQQYKATAGTIPTGHLRSFGVPTIRSDLAAPRLKRVSDHKVKMKS